MKTNFKLLGTYLIIFTCILSSCEKDPEPEPGNGTVTDIEGNVYKTLKIGTQWWMTENLKTTKFNDGTSIPLVSDQTEWTNLTTPGCCWYGNDKVAFGDIYGALYNWFTLSSATNGGKNVCPTGWHIPTDAEWKQLEMNLGMSQKNADTIEWRGTSEGGKLKETGFTHWLTPNTGSNNSSGFTGLPGGYRWSDGYFNNVGFYGLWWSATESEYDASYAWRRTLSCENAGIYRYYSPKASGHSVRCVRNN